MSRMISRSSSPGRLICRSGKHRSHFLQRKSPEALEPWGFFGHRNVIRWPGAALQRRRRDGGVSRLIFIVVVHSTAIDTCAPHSSPRHHSPVSFFLLRWSAERHARAVAIAETVPVAISTISITCPTRRPPVSRRPVPTPPFPTSKRCTPAIRGVRVAAARPSATSATRRHHRQPFVGRDGKSALRRSSPAAGGTVTAARAGPGS